MSQSGPALPPPPPGALAMGPTLAPETVAFIARLNIDTQPLKKAAQAGDEAAKRALVDLYNQHYQHWATYVKNHVRPITDQITALENQKRCINEEITNNIERLRLTHEKLEKERNEYQEQKVEFSGIPGSEAFIQEIDYLLEVQLLAQAQALNVHAEQRRESLQIALTAANDNIAMLRAAKKAPDNEAFQLKKIYESLPKPKGKFQAAKEDQEGAVAMPRRGALDIEDWILGKKQDPSDANSPRAKAVLGGIFIRNLTRFLMTHEDVQENKEYTIEELVRKYNGFTNPQLQGLNERIILGIAVGYIRRNDAAPYCVSHIQFLRDTQIDPTKEAFLNAFLAKFYTAFPEIEQTSDILLNAPAQAGNLPCGLQAIQRDIQQAVQKANHPGRGQGGIVPFDRPIPPLVPRAAALPIPELNAPPPKRNFADLDRRKEEVEQAARAGQRAQKDLQPVLKDLRAGFDAEIVKAQSKSQQKSTFVECQQQTQSIMKALEQLSKQLQAQLAQEKIEKDAEKARADQLEVLAEQRRLAQEQALQQARQAQERERVAQHALAQERLRVQRAQQQPQAVAVDYGALLSQRNIPGFINAYRKKENRDAKFADAIRVCPPGLAGDQFLERSCKNTVYVKSD